MRLLFIVLLLANIAFLAWQYQARGFDDHDAALQNFRATDPGTTPLMLLSERPDAASTEPGSAGAAEVMALAPAADEDSDATPEPIADMVEDDPAESGQNMGAVPQGQPDDEQLPRQVAAAPAVTRRCYELGPSTDRASIERAQAAVRQAGGQTSLREAVQSVADGYWVRLPEYLTYAGARARYRELQRVGVDDIAIVALPDKRYFISLGVYKKERTRWRIAAMRSSPWA
ncbi:MAG: hypothetical protein IPK65_02335 [Gammaproteobacteria bacterium]|nr:hypothetical protein [Gammaproteobacteria bacterium]